VRKQWRQKLKSAGLSVGDNKKYYLMLLLFTALYMIGHLVSNGLGLSVPGQEFNLGRFFSTAGISFVSLVFTWPVYFGEEYGWRFYLQDKLFTLVGGYKGVVLVGLIWGLWHLPLMIMGLNFPGEPAVTANLVYLVYTIALSVIFGYTVVKTKSVLIAVGLHGLTDITVNAGRALLPVPTR
jgi:membrane protease YdiL (CAAX protease family)